MCHLGNRLSFFCVQLRSYKSTKTVVLRDVNAYLSVNRSHLDIGGTEGTE